MINDHGKKGWKSLFWLVLFLVFVSMGINCAMGPDKTSGSLSGTIQFEDTNIVEEIVDLEPLEGDKE